MVPLIEPEMALYPVSRSDDLLVSVADMKEHLNEGDSSKDTLIGFLIEAVTEGLESELRRALVDQTWDLKLSGFASCGWRHHHHGLADIVLPRPPLISVDSITYYDTNNALQTLAASTYEVIGANNRQGQGRIRTVLGQSFPAVYSRAEPVTVRFRSGYLTSDSPAVEDVPKDLKQLIRLMVADNYANRETIVIGQSTMELKIAEWIMRRYRVYD